MALIKEEDLAEVESYLTDSAFLQGREFEKRVEMPLNP